MPSTDTRVIRVFTGAGIAWQLCIQAYWLLFFVRVSTELEFTPLELVLFGTAKEVSVLTFEVPTGVVADLYSRKLSVVIAFFVAGIAIAMAGVADSLGLLLGAAALWGFGLTFRSGAETAWLTAELGSAEAAEPVLLERARVVLIAKVVGVVLAGALAALTSLATALLTFGLLLVAAALVLAALMPEDNFQPVQTDRWGEFRRLLSTGAGAARRIRPLRILVVATVVAGFGSEALDRLYVRQLDDLAEQAISGAGILWVAAISVAQAIVGAMLLGVVVRRFQGEGVVPGTVVMLATTAIGALIFAQVGIAAVAAVGLVITGAARSAIEALKIAWTNRWAPHETRATVHSMVGQAHSLGEITGGVALGALATAAGLPLALTIAAGLYLASSVVTSRAGYDGT